MSTYVYMRLLESAPRRYDLGIRLLSLGGAAEMYAQVASSAVQGAAAARVLELGCGTGSLTTELVARGATVTAIDQDPEMLALARSKLEAAGQSADLREMTAAEIADRLPAASFDAVAATLVLSEMSEDERAFVLRRARELLRPGGRLVVADEVRPRGLLARVAHACVRWPLAAITYVLTQSSTSAVPDLAGLVRAAGFRVLEERRLAKAGVVLVVGERPADDGTPPPRGEQP